MNDPQDYPQPVDTEAPATPLPLGDGRRSTPPTLAAAPPAELSSAPFFPDPEGPPMAAVIADLADLAPEDRRRKAAVLAAGRRAELRTYAAIYAERYGRRLDQRRLEDADPYLADLDVAAAE